MDMHAYYVQHFKIRIGIQYGESAMPAAIYLKEVRNTISFGHDGYNVRLRKILFERYKVVLPYFS